MRHSSVEEPILQGFDQYFLLVLTVRQRLTNPPNRSWPGGVVVTSGNDMNVYLGDLVTQSGDIHFRSIGQLLQLFANLFNALGHLGKRSLGQLV